VKTDGLLSIKDVQAEANPVAPLEAALADLPRSTRASYRVLIGHLDGVAPPPSDIAKAGSPD
jgi:hypothetical protein